jgi:peptide/nickel transport system substrate-binding protein
VTSPGSSRRRLAAGTVVVVATLLATAACGGGGSSSSAKAPGFNAAVKGVVANKSTKTGGTIKYAGAQDFDSLDPTRQYYGFAWDFSRYYSRQLVSFTAAPGSKSTELTGDLATSNAKITDNGKTYTYTLRDGVTWQDGTAITSKDVKYGIERSWAQDVLSGGPTYLNQILDPKGEYKGPYKDKTADKLGLKAIDTPDDKTIVFHLPKANGDFEQILALPSASPVKASKDTAAKYTLQPFSSGPYKFATAYSPGKGGTLVRNTAWKKSSDPIRAALPDKVSVAINSSADDIDNRLIKGDYDLDLNATGLSQAGRTKALKQYKANVDNMTTSYIRYAVFASTVKPFDNINCRKAVIYAADHTALQTARGGPLAGGALAPNMLPTSIKGSDSYDPYSILKGAADTTKAKAALAACGKPNGFSTTIAVRNNKPAEVATAEALQESLAKVGITAQIDQIDGAQSSSITGSPSVVKKKGYGIDISGWGPDFPTGQGFLQPLIDGRFVLQSGNYNFSELNDASINKLFDQAIAETDPVKAGDIYQQINHKLSDEAWYLPFVYEKNITWRSTRLTNVYQADAYGGRYDYVNLGVK